MAGKSIVALVPCDSYDDSMVEAAVREGIDLIGGTERFVRAGEKILLKPNVLVGSAPEKCVCTHPAVLRATAMAFRNAGAVLSCGDSSAVGGCALNMRLAGLKAVTDELTIPLADFSGGSVVHHSDALLYHQFTIAAGVQAADGLVSLCKLKTHALTRMTGAVKNQFGCIPGMLKAQQHSRLPNAYDFATMLVDLNTLLKPRLYIMDAVMAMEGNGPRGGDPRKIGLLIFSDDPIALDATACRLIDLDPELVPTMKPGEKAGLGTYHMENIEIRGASIEQFVCRDFNAVRKPPDRLKGGRMGALFKQYATPRPVIDSARCTRCGTCVRACPVQPGAVHWRTEEKTSPPVYDYQRCIRCFCCQEVCPEGAISIETPWLGKLISR